MSLAPTVTVGIPVYNASRFLRSAIRSVLSQTYGDFELIITDDGSSDHSVDIAREFDDSRIHVLSDGKNLGISARLNQQIDLAKGKYFVRMDADDIMLPDRLEKQVAYLDAHPDVDVIGGGAIIIDDDNNIIGQRIRSSIKAHTPGSYDYHFMFIHPTVAGRIAFFRKYHYSDELKGVEDRELWTRATLDSTMHILPEFVMAYRDPLKVKLKTYLFRGCQTRRFLESSRVRATYTNVLRAREIVVSYIKGMIMFSCSLLGLSRIIIARRNRPASHEALMYAEFLKEA